MFIFGQKVFDLDKKVVKSVQNGPFLDKKCPIFAKKFQKVSKSGPFSDTKNGSFLAKKCPIWAKKCQKVDFWGPSQKHKNKLNKYLLILGHERSN